MNKISSQFSETVEETVLTFLLKLTLSTTAILMRTKFPEYLFAKFTHVYQIVHLSNVLPLCQIH